MVEEEARHGRRAVLHHARGQSAHAFANKIRVQVRGQAASAAAGEQNVGGGLHVVEGSQLGQRGLEDLVPAEEDLLATHRDGVRTVAAEAIAVAIAAHRCEVSER